MLMISQDCHKIATSEEWCWLLLESPHCGCCICYAEDVALLAPSPSALHHMLDTCLHFASSHSLVFNATKTQLIRFAWCGAGNQLSFHSYRS